MREEPDRKQNKKLTFKTFKNDNFRQQGITLDRKSFITEPKHMDMTKNVERNVDILYTL